MNNDIFLYTLKYITSYEDMHNICKTNLRFYNACKNNNKLVSKYLLRLYKVDYSDPTNYIYVHNNVNIDEYKSKTGWLYSKIWLLYFKDYYKDEIICDNEGITTFPIYPNMKSFFGEKNKINRFYTQPNMIEFWGERNNISKFDIQPNMEEFHGDYNEIETFYIQPNMIECWINSNKLEKFLVQPKMTQFYGAYNHLETFDIQPSMIYCDISNNRLNNFPIQPNMITFVGNDNNLSEFVIQPRLSYCTIDNNINLTIFPVQPLLKSISARNTNLNRNILENFPEIRYIRL